MLIAAVALVGVFVAVYLTLYKLGMIGTLACGTGGCETVQLSKWGDFLGLPVAAWGVGFYVATLVVAIVGTQERYGDSRAISLILVAMSGWGVLFSAWLTYLELAVIHAICRYCVVSAVLVLIIFVLSVMDWREQRAVESAVLE